jgi:type III pantothenate kinase
MVTILDSFSRKYLGHAPHWIDARSYPGMPILYSNPNEVGADRIVNAVGAYHRYQTSLIVIDFGTATTFDVISANGEYLGGAISPGIGIASEALFRQGLQAAARGNLPAARQRHRQGYDRQPAIRHHFRLCGVGGRHGAAHPRRNEGRPKSSPPAAWRRLIQNVSTSIEVVEPNLTLDGLKIIADSLEKKAG